MFQRNRSGLFLLSVCASTCLLFINASAMAQHRPVNSRQPETPSHRALPLPVAGSTDLRQQIEWLQQLQSILNRSNSDSTASKFDLEHWKKLQEMLKQLSNEKSGDTTPPLEQELPPKQNGLSPDQVSRALANPAMREQIQKLLEQLQLDGARPQTMTPDASKLSQPANQQRRGGLDSRPQETTPATPELPPVIKNLLQQLAQNRPADQPRSDTPSPSLDNDPSPKASSDTPRPDDPRRSNNSSTTSPPRLNRSPNGLPDLNPRPAPIPPIETQAVDDSIRPRVNMSPDELRETARRLLQADENRVASRDDAAAPTSIPSSVPPVLADLIKRFGPLDHSDPPGVELDNHSAQQNLSRPQENNVNTEPTKPKPPFSSSNSQAGRRTPFELPSPHEVDSNTSSNQSKPSGYQPTAPDNFPLNRDAKNRSATETQPKSIQEMNNHRFQPDTKTPGVRSNNLNPDRNRSETQGESLLNTGRPTQSSQNADVTDAKSVSRPTGMDVKAELQQSGFAQTLKKLVEQAKTDSLSMADRPQSEPDQNGNRLANQASLQIRGSATASPPNGAIGQGRDNLKAPQRDSLNRLTQGLQQDLSRIVNEAHPGTRPPVSRPDTNRSFPPAPVQPESRSSVSKLAQAANKALTGLTTAPAPRLSSSQSSGSMNLPSGPDSRSAFGLLLLVGVLGLLMFAAPRLTSVVQKWHHGESMTPVMQAADITSRRDIIRAFHQFALNPAVVASSWWTHRQVEKQVAETKPALQPAVQALTELYEQARYLPENADFTSEQIATARQAFEQCESKSRQ